MIKLIITILITLPMIVNASEFLNKRAEGWHWYEDKVKEESKNDNQPTAPTPMTATQMKKALQQQVEEALDTAIMDPTPENVYAYVHLQQYVMNRASKFSDTWQKVVATNPELDESLKHPVMQSARNVYFEQQAETKQKLITDLRDKYGLFFFYSSKCGYCHKFAPIVRSFATSHRLNVMAISADGGPLPEFPEAQMNNGIIEKLGIKAYPALIAFDAKTQELIPLSYGMTSEADLENKIMLLMGEEQ
jgi:conjugal transfer pilus assembly protein TraF